MKSQAENSKTMNIQIGLAGLSDQLELRVSLACRLLAASQLCAQVQHWKGQPCELLVVDLESSHGRIAYEVAMKRNLPLLVFNHAKDAIPAAGVRQLDFQAPAATVARTLHDILRPSSTPAADNIEGLLSICLQEIGCSDEVLARHGHISLILRHAAGRIHARSLSELLAAGAQLLDPTWLCQLHAMPKEREYEWQVSCSLESFLVMACLKHRASLPMLGASYRLNRWPDLGSVTNDLASLRMAALLSRAAWSVQALAQHMNIDVWQVNAFGWATLASGSLSVEGQAYEVIPQPQVSALAEAPSILQRVARHFGLKISHSYVET